MPFRGVTHREAVLLQGRAGWGEFAPFLDYDDVESARWLAAALEAAERGWPAPVRARVPVNATVPAVAASDVADVLARFPGCTTAKVKVAAPGQRLVDDLDRVAAVRDALGASGHVRVDANGGWTLREAVDALAALSRFGLQYAEQPCASLDDLAALRNRLARRSIDVPIAVDESIRKADDPLRVALAGAADVVVLKVAPLGGVSAALRVAEQCGLPVVVSSALDTSVGIRAGIALAAALPDLPYACGLATVALLAGDVCTEPLDGRGGAIAVEPIQVDAALLDRWAAPPDLQVWWRARVERCRAVLQADSPP